MTHDFKSENYLYTYFVIRNKNKDILISLQLKFSDKIREEAFDFIHNIKQSLQSLFIISGDYKENVQEIANYLNIKEFYPNMSYLLMA
jgi:cation transport ATPase